MTTIAYHHERKEIAYDGRLTQGDLIISDQSPKAFISDKGVRFFLSGALSDALEFCNEFSGGNKASRDYECEGFMIEGGVVFLVGCDDRTQSFFACKAMNNMACGSGSHFALSAMDFGRSAFESVEYAATRNICTGGKITVVGVE